jgi:hypothetical protein
VELHLGPTAPDTRIQLHFTGNVSRLRIQTRCLLFLQALHVQQQHGLLSCRPLARWASTLPPITFVLWSFVLHTFYLLLHRVTVNHRVRLHVVACVGVAREYSDLYTTLTVHTILTPHTNDMSRAFVLLNLHLGPTASYSAPHTSAAHFRSSFHALFKVT